MLYCIISVVNPPLQVADADRRIGRKPSLGWPHQ